MDLTQIIFGAVIGFILTKLLEPVWDGVKNTLKKAIHAKNIIKSSDYLAKTFGLVSLDHADPSYDLMDIEVNEAKQKLFIGFPMALKERILELDASFEFREDMSFNGGDDFLDLVQMTGIDNLDKLISEHRVKVADQFIEKINKGVTLFNGKKYGVFNLLRRRSGSHENANLKLDLFITDYFTHKVFRSIYYELRSSGHQISNLNKIEELHSYRPFTTSFGINAFVICVGDFGSDEIIFARRSKYISNTGGKDCWHVTMNEALTFTDLEEGNVSLKKCLHRGLKEELGLRDEFHKYIIEEKFMDIFLEKNEFEIGLTAYVEVKMEFSDLRKLHGIAKDSELETDGLVAIPLDKGALREFINNGDLTSAALYSLDMYTSRKKYFINSTSKKF
jgi:hypothetical protein